MATMTTRAAALALAGGVSLAGGLVGASAASAASVPLPGTLCVATTSPLHPCVPSENGFNPEAASVGDHTAINFFNYKPGSTILITIPSFPRFERSYSAKVGSNGNVTFSLLVPLNALPQIAYNATIQGVAINGGAVQYVTKVVVHTAKKPKIVQLLRDKNLYFNIAPSVQKNSDKKIIAAYYKKLHAASVAGSKGAATTTSVAIKPAAATTATAPTGGLAFTGAEIAGMSLVGAGLLGTGAFLVVAGRRRKGTQSV